MTAEPQEEPGAKPPAREPDAPPDELCKRALALAAQRPEAIFSTISTIIGDEPKKLAICTEQQIDFLTDLTAIYVQAKERKDPAVISQLDKESFFGLELAIAVCQMNPEAEDAALKLLPLCRKLGFDPRMPVVRTGELSSYSPLHRHRHILPNSPANRMLLLAGVAKHKPKLVKWLLDAGAPLETYRQGLPYTILQSDALNGFGSPESVATFTSLVFDAVRQRGVDIKSFLDNGASTGNSAVAAACSFGIYKGNEKRYQIARAWLKTLAEKGAAMDGPVFLSEKLLPLWEVIAREIKLDPQPEKKMILGERFLFALEVGIPAPVREARNICGLYLREQLAKKKNEPNLPAQLLTPEGTLSGLGFHLAATGLLHEAYRAQDWNDSPGAFHQFLEEKIAPLLTDEQRQVLEQDTRHFAAAHRILPAEAKQTWLARYVADEPIQRER